VGVRGIEVATKKVNGMRTRFWMTLAWTQAGIGGLGLCSALAQGTVEIGGQAKISASGWNVSGGERGLDFRWGGQLITTYCTSDGKKPYFYPLVGPTGEGLTRGFPMDPQPDEARDHPHHRSLFFGHRNVNGIDFWSAETHTEKTKAAGMRAGTVRQAALNGIQIGAGTVTLRVRNDWLDDLGKKLGEDSRVYGLTRLENGDIALDWDITIQATETDLTFGDDKDGTMAVRVIPTLQVKAAKESGKPATGHILNSEGVRDTDAWGKRAKWVDYFGVDRKGKPVGMAMFDHPQNLRHPTWWHARDYGLFAANPFGIHYFENKEEHAGDYTVKKGESLRFRYRLLLHRGGPDAKQLDQAWQDWAK
jgi:hypothetical protein